MYSNPALLHAFLDHLTEAITVYAGYQIESGAQVSSKMTAAGSPGRDAA